MRDNFVKQALQRGETVFGSMATEMRSPAIALLFANAGFDFFFIDMEHGSYDMTTVADIIKVARLADICPIVRVPDPEYHLMSRPLDAGAQGLMIPRVETREVVEHIVRCVRYPPAGVRGCSIPRGHNEYTSAPVDEFTKHANENVLIVVQIERRRAVEDIDALLSVPGVDVALIGPQDLCVSLGTMDPQHPETEAAIQTVINAAQRHGVAAGIHSRDVDVLLQWQERGIRMLTCSTDTDFIEQGARAAVGTLRRTT